MSAINWFRLYRKKNGSVTTRIDAIQIIGENSLSNTDIVIEKSIQIFPNPVDTMFYVNFTLPKTASVSVTLMNSKGQLVLQPFYKHHLHLGNQRLEVSVERLKPGVYFAQIKIDDNLFTKKIIIE